MNGDDRPRCRCGHVERVHLGTFQHAYLKGESLCIFPDCLCRHFRLAGSGVAETLSRMPTREPVRVKTNPVASL